MANWKEKIELNGVLQEISEKYDLSYVEDDCPEEVKNALANEVLKSSALKSFAPIIRRAKSIASVNCVLAMVFDVADTNLVWCGF